MAKEFYLGNETTIEERKAHWKDMCNEYLKIFCKKHEYTYEPDMWVSNNPGTIVMIGDMFVNMDNIRYDIDYSVPESFFEEWYWKSLELHELGIEHWMNYECFCKGAPDEWTKEKMDNLRAAKKKFEDAKNDFEKLIVEYKKQNNNFSLNNLAI